MLDPEKVKSFWEKRSNRYNELASESIVNLEQNPENLKIKIRDETNKIFSWLPELQGKSILDLGSGIGQWTFRFVERGADKITAVEYIPELVNIGKQEAEQNGYDNVEFIVFPAEDFICDEFFDIIFVSGLFLYLNDDQMDKILGNLIQMSSPDTLIMIRDSVGVFERYEINNRFSDHLQEYYSAIYRTAEDYIDLFSHAGFECINHENMFPEGHPLNKYPETRLHLFNFRKQ